MGGGSFVERRGPLVVAVAAVVIGVIVDHVFRPPAFAEVYLAFPYLSGVLPGRTVVNVVPYYSNGGKRMVMPSHGVGFTMVNGATTYVEVELVASAVGSAVVTRVNVSPIRRSSFINSQ